MCFFRPSHSICVYGVQGFVHEWSWSSSKSLFFEKPKIEVAIVKSYLWSHKYNTLRNDLAQWLL